MKLNVICDILLLLLIPFDNEFCGNPKNGISCFIVLKVCNSKRNVSLRKQKREEKNIQTLLIYIFRFAFRVTCRQTTQLLICVHVSHRLDTVMCVYTPVLHSVIQ